MPGSSSSWNDTSTSWDYEWPLGSSAWPEGSANDTVPEIPPPKEPPGPNNWWALLALFLVLATAAGNILVCLAISWERRLQNVTNYFLMSLAITDLMVAMLVMPLGILTLVKGESSLIPQSEWFTVYSGQESYSYLYAPCTVGQIRQYRRSKVQTRRYL